MRALTTVLLTGGSGFVGKPVEKKLRDSFLRVFSLHRPTTDSFYSSSQGSLVIRGDVTDLPSMKASLTRLGHVSRQIDAIVHLVGAIAEEDGMTFHDMHVKATENMLALAKEYSVKKFIHMSAIGARAGAESTYHRTKFQAEKLVMDSGVPYTIFRPSLIFGKNAQIFRMIKDLIKIPVYTPVLGDGTGKVQPVFVEDIAAMILHALSDEATDNQIYDVGGPKVYSFLELVSLVEKHLGREKSHIHLPIWVGEILAKVSTSLWPVLKLILHSGSSDLLSEHLIPPQFNRDQLIMMQESHTADVDSIEKTFGIKLHGLEEWLGAEGLKEEDSPRWIPRYKGEGPKHSEPNRPAA